MLLYSVILTTTALACYLVGILVGKKVARMEDRER